MLRSIQLNAGETDFVPEHLDVVEQSTVLDLSFGYRIARQYKKAVVNGGDC
jgi:hypothetical protein